MAETVIGLSALERRLAAIATPGTGLMQLAASAVRGRMVLNMAAIGARKTGLTAGSLIITGVTATSAQIVGSRVIEFIDEGTGLYGPAHHRITPKVAMALRWMGGPAGSLRLTGQARKGKAGAGAAWVFARSTAGMRARPFIQRSVAEGGQQAGVELGATIISEWNGA